MAFVVARYLTLKQILPQLELFESGFEDELKWLDEALNALEAYKNVNTLEEVEKELGRYTVSRHLIITSFVDECVSVFCEPLHIRM